MKLYDKVRVKRDRGQGPIYTIIWIESDHNDRIVCTLYEVGSGNATITVDESHLIKEDM